ncbi:four helix bundle protein [Candidatus Parcubacteria bacterium]|nr:MAG: four helix bundle protein [Candidatus Parcubacteria bacterium]
MKNTQTQSERGSMTFSPLGKFGYSQFLNIARRSLFEDALMLLVFDKMDLFEAEDDLDSILTECDHLSRMITNYSRKR